MVPGPKLLLMAQPLKHPQSESATLHAEVDSSADQKRSTDTQEIDLNGSQSRKFDK